MTLDLPREAAACWNAAGIARPAATQAELAKAEARCGIRFSRTFGDLYLAADGMAAGASDRHALRFWPLSELEPATHRTNDSLLIFADWSLSAHEYAISLGGRSEADSVVIVGGDATIVVASDFSVFLNFYLHEPDRLFPQAAPPKASS